jgi:hypothetical protein
MISCPKSKSRPRAPHDSNVIVAKNALAQLSLPVSGQTFASC